MKRCSNCQKPLTEFEIHFHKEAETPDGLFSKCWTCSGAEKAFEKARLDAPKDWYQSGASGQAINNLAWYENQFTQIKNSRNQNTISG